MKRCKISTDYQREISVLICFFSCLPAGRKLCPSVEELLNFPTEKVEVRFKKVKIISRRENSFEQTTSFMKERIRKILKLLKKTYGKSPPFRRTDPIGQLIGTVLSQNTTDRNSWKAFRILKKNFKSWDGILKADVNKIASLIRHAGLADIKARRIKDILKEIRKREGRINLTTLKDLSVRDSLEYLNSLKGVGPKTAACVLLFSFGKPVMPVDTHIFRVTKRLGLIDKQINIEEAHESLTALVPGGLIYDFHLGIIEHGRRTCKAQNPRCGTCVLYRLCKFKGKSFVRRKG